MKRAMLTLMALGASTVAMAETIELDLSELPSRTVFETAEAMPLAVTADGAPAVMLLRVPAGVEVPPHATETGLRLLTVIEGPMSWGDGETIDRAAERTYPAGSVLMLPAGLPHWLAARGDGDVLLQLILLDDESPVAAVEDQMR